MRTTARIAGPRGLRRNLYLLVFVSVSGALVAAFYLWNGFALTRRLAWAVG